MATKHTLDEWLCASKTKKKNLPFYTINFSYETKAPPPLKQIIEHTRANHQRLMTDHQICFIDYEILYEIQQHPGITQHALGASIDKTTSTVNRHINGSRTAPGLIGMNLVCYTCPTEGKHKAVLTLTPEGEDLLTEVNKMELIGITPRTENDEREAIKHEEIVT